MIKLAAGAAILYFAWSSLPLKPYQILHYLLGAGGLFYGSIALFALFLMLQAAIWVSILNSFEGKQLTLRTGLLVYINSQFAKYIPGGIWNYAGRVMLASREGARLEAQMSAIVYENLLLVAAASVYTLALTIYLDLLPVYVLYLFGGLLLAFFLGYKQLSKWMREALFLVIRKFPIRRVRGLAEKYEDVALQLGRGAFFLHLLYFIASHMVMGAAFWLLIQSFDLPQVSLWYAAGTFASSWMLGLMSPLPGGIGVREGFLVYFLSFHATAAIAAQISIIARIWNLLAEALFFFLMNALHYLAKRVNRHVS